MLNKLRSAKQDTKWKAVALLTIISAIGIFGGWIYFESTVVEAPSQNTAHLQETLSGVEQAQKEFAAAREAVAPAIQELTSAIQELADAVATSTNNTETSTEPTPATAGSSTGAESSSVIE